MTSLLHRDPQHHEMADWIGRWLDARGLGDWAAGSGPAPAIRVEELTRPDAYVLRAELPGVDPDRDVEISVHDGVLHIEGERGERSEEREGATFRSEFRYGRFERTLPLPAGATVEDVAATYRDGVLEVTVPLRTEAREAARVPVQRTD